jgi:hypothetical protein
MCSETNSSIADIAPAGLTSIEANRHDSADVGNSQAARTKTIRPHFTRIRDE